MKLGRCILFAFFAILHVFSAQNNKLAPTAISGKIMDQDGDPINLASVGLVHDFWKGGKLYHFANRSAVSNDLGQYRIGNLAPGKYYVYVWKPDHQRRAADLSPTQASRTFAPSTPSIRKPQTSRLPLPSPSPPARILPGSM